MIFIGMMCFSTGLLRNQTTREDHIYFGVSELGPMARSMTCWATGNQWIFGSRKYGAVTG